MSYKSEYEDAIAGRFHDLENRIMFDIVRRIQKEGKITSTADWQINRLVALGKSSADIENMIKDTLNMTYPEIFELYDEVIGWEYVRSVEIYEQINEKFIPYEENDQLQQWLSAAKAETKDTLVNLTSTLGVVSNINGQMTFLPLTDFYQKELDAAVMDITSGAFDYNSVLKRTVKTLSNSGIRTIDYDSGYTSRLPVAVRRAVMTSVSQLAGRISEMNAAKLGVDCYEVAWHAGARPSHREWQGKVYTKQELIDICGLGTVTGLLGANCYHEYYPFIPGISERNWSDKWLEEQNQNEDIHKTFMGKEYTTYEALQKQRQMETSMRAQRQKVRLMQEGEADNDDIVIEKARYQGQLTEYRKFSEVMNIKPQMERVYIDGLGRIAPNEKVFRTIEHTMEKRYNKGNILDNLKVFQKDDSLQKKIKNREYILKIDSGKQGKHIKGHNNYVEGKSYLSITEKEAQVIVYKFAGTGDITRDAKGKWNNKEVITADREIGFFVDLVTGKEVPTNRATLHYAKKGVHVVPARPKEEWDGI